MSEALDVFRAVDRRLVTPVGRSRVTMSLLGEPVVDERVLTAEPEDAFALIYQVGERPAHDLWSGPRRTRVPPGPRATLHVVDLRETSVARIVEPFETVHVHIPRRALSEIAEMSGAAEPTDLHAPPGLDTRDAVVEGVQQGLLCALRGPAHAPDLATQHLALALVAHVASAYGDMRSKPGRPSAGLAPWQVRRATELMAADLAEPPSLAELAAECGLSPCHFSRCFKVSTGLSPQAWLQALRVERAKAMIRAGELSLSAIALACGFADQSGFTRVFARLAGATPAVWRRHHRG